MHFARVYIESQIIKYKSLSMLMMLAQRRAENTCRSWTDYEGKLDSHARLWSFVQHAVVY